MSDPVELLSRLIAVDTHNPGGDERAAVRARSPRSCARAAAKCASSRCRATAASAPTCSRTWGTPRLLVNAHVDTVPVNAGWSADPFTARVAEGRVVGLGACDTKGAIASLSVRARRGAAARSGHRLHRRRRAHRHRHSRAPRTTSATRSPSRAAPSSASRPSCRAGTRHRGILWIEATHRRRAAATARAPTSCRRRSPTPRASRSRFAEWGQRAARARARSAFAACA